MVKEQKAIIVELENYRSGKSIQWMAKELEMERTRLFRIIKGHEMRLSEYFKIKKYLNLEFKNSDLNILEPFSIGFKKEIDHMIGRARLAKGLIEGSDFINLMGKIS